MLKTIAFLILSAVFFFFIACKKDNNNNNTTTGASSLSGTWNFTGMHATTSATAIDNGGGINSKIVTTSDYKTTSNGGTLGISGNTMTGTGITYSANILALATEYEDDILIDTFSTTIPFTVPATNTSTEFEIIGKDSIHYTGANLFGSGGSGTPAATGAKFSLSGNILTLTSIVVQDKIQDEGGGETLTQHETATVVTTLQKQ
ncbi:MAG TPA: hypothetical protein VGH64_05175 [Puia sp.]|jgi:hypothetical protein